MIHRVNREINKWVRLYEFTHQIVQNRKTLDLQMGVGLEEGKAFSSWEIVGGGKLLRAQCDTLLLALGMIHNFRNDCRYVRIDLALSVLIWGSRGRGVKCFMLKRLVDSIVSRLNSIDDTFAEG